jgi:hypothetical protein
MPDDFAGMSPGLESPAQDAAAVAPNDGVDLPNTARALYIGGAGDVVAILKNDTASVTFKNVPAGTQLMISAKRVLATGTTATFIVALW